MVLRKSTRGEQHDDNNDYDNTKRRTSFYKAIGPYGCQPDTAVIEEDTGDTMLGYVKDDRGLWQGDGTILYKNGAGYSGAVVDSRREGLGVYIAKGGAVYRGEWKDDEPDGMGKWEQCDSSYYVGEFKAGRKHGRGYHFSPFGGGGTNSSSSVGVTYYEMWSEGTLVEQSRVTQQSRTSWGCNLAHNWSDNVPVAESLARGKSVTRLEGSTRVSTVEGSGTAAAATDFNTCPMGSWKPSRQASKSRIDSGRQQSYGSHRSSVLLPPDALGGPLGPASSSSGMGPAPRSVVEWNTEDVVRWLSRVLHLGQYGDIFRRAHISGPTLLLVSNQFLKSRLGVKSLGHRTKILAGIDQLRHDLSMSHEHGWSSRPAGQYLSSASTSGSSALLNRPLLGSNQSLSSVTAVQPTLGEVPYDTWYIPFEELEFGPRLDPRPENSPVGVYRGSWLGKDVAIRMYRAQLVNSHKWWSAVRHLDQIRHTNICLFMGVSISEPYYCIVWEFAEYGSLEDLLHFDRCPPGGKRHQVVKPPLPVSMALHVARGIAVACSYLQRIPGLGNGPGGHLDLKPSNVLVDSSFNVKLTDFCLNEIESCFLLLPGEGIRRPPHSRYDKRVETGGSRGASCLVPVAGERDDSRVTTAALDNTAASSQDEYCVTDRRVLVRDASYMAPEVLRLPVWHLQLGIDYRCDVYSFGVILWELLTCRRAYAGFTNSQIRAYVGYGDGTLPRLCYSAPSDVRHLLRRCLDANPANRPTFDSAIQRLARLQGRMNTVAEDALISFMAGV
ncbi:hypothetical protein FOZ61_008618 [Perkinsus olseni]|uniref:Protein kinase n=1 Tax=Perkinsus olseni TaxID=32597 RepID=A0A7J6M6L0_PEROL|nr:hypothetical protein FOZ61_008618 [Perkinsus olseni]